MGSQDGSSVLESTVTSAGGRDLNLILDDGIQIDAKTVNETLRILLDNETVEVAFPISRRDMCIFICVFRYEPEDKW
jgi:hypothetical protein